MDKRHRYAVLGVGLTMLVGSQVLPAVGDEGFPPHGHLLLRDAEVEWLDEVPPMTPPYRIHGFAGCSELANGRQVPMHAHHERMHFGQAGRSVTRGGNMVVPTAPLFPGIESCADLEAALPYPPAPAT